mgnify:FL=1
MIYCFDLDGTLCSTPDESYKDAEPHMDRIYYVNSLFEKGHTIIIETARGTMTGIDWFCVTKNQLSEWGLKYTQLRTGIKFAADVYIDDKCVNSENFFD